MMASSWPSRWQSLATRRGWATASSSTTWPRPGGKSEQCSYNKIPMTLTVETQQAVMLLFDFPQPPRGSFVDFPVPEERDGRDDLLLVPLSCSDHNGHPEY